MNTMFILLGVICLIAAIVGGGLKAAGVELPVVVAVRRQVLLGLLGVVLIFAGAFMGSGSGGGYGDNEVTSVPPIDDIQDVRNATADPDTNDQATNEQGTNEQAAQNPASSENNRLPTEVEEKHKSNDPSTAPAATPRVPRVEDVADALTKNPPTMVYTRNQYSKGRLTYTQFLVNGLDMLVTTNFVYDQGDGTGWPPASPPVAAIDDYFCSQNPNTAKLLKNHTKIAVTSNVTRGPGTASFNFAVDCNPNVEKLGPTIP